MSPSKTVSFAEFKSMPLVQTNYVGGDLGKRETILVRVDSAREARAKLDAIELAASRADAALESADSFGDWADFDTDSNGRTVHNPAF